ncbi:MAG: hypothetical protein INH41_01945 [Myxococcaceae bacterium]|jgi:hypothetical protein|nr:hypothetical protein [Myxococcaceae bacterium]MCA3011140.1 hypothetical protein [Myxococcaceae bacterium]
MTLRSGLVLATLLASSACTAVGFTTLPASRAPNGVFITAQGLTEPYESVGLLQLTRRGVLLFGWGDVAGTDLSTAVSEVEQQLRRSRADGLINTHVVQTNYTTMARILGLLFFFVPLPSEVTITGELVRLRREAPGPAAPLPQPLPGGTAL